MAKQGSLWVLDSQLETEIHSFSESPPSDVSKYHRGPLVKGPKGPRGGAKVLTPILGHFLLFFKVLLLSQFQAEMVLFQYGAIKSDLLEGPYSKTEPSKNFY